MLKLTAAVGVGCGPVFHDWSGTRSVQDSDAPEQPGYFLAPQPGRVRGWASPSRSR